MVMKKLSLLLLLSCCVLACGNAQPKNIKLNAPNKERGKATMQALSERKSTREFAEQELSLQDLSDLLWAANGFNREDKRTAGTAMNCQEIDVYVCMKSGAYLYDAKANELVVVASEDIRELFVAGQDYVKQAPVCLLIVADLSRMKGGDTEAGKMSTALDAGIVSQNISLFCSGCDMATVTRGMMNKKKLAEALKLADTQYVHLNHPVGYFRK